MKRFIQIAMAVMVLIVGSSSTILAQRYSLGGRVINSAGQPIPYATVVLLEQKSQITGTTTNSEGRYTITATSGNYTLNVSYVGYKSAQLDISLTENTTLDDITLAEDSEKIDEVVVTAQLIRREADRFVVDVANSPIAIGKDGEELLKTAPGVWIQDDAISINGASGSKVYINDREVKMDKEQLIAYLRSLRAEDIQRIEVIPLSGADYDASSSGGIINITTKKRNDSGLMGTTSLVVNGTKGMYNVMPSLSLNYNRGKINAYGRAWFGTTGNNNDTTEHTTYTNTESSVIDAKSLLYNKSLWGGGNVGVVYDITDKHSLGGEIQYNYYGGNGDTDTWTERKSSETATRIEGLYSNDYTSQMVTATLNYIYKLDNKGSKLKFIGDYTSSRYPNYNHYIDTTYELQEPNTKSTMESRDNTQSHYQLGTATVALEQVLSPKVTLKAGVKYTNNTNSNIATYDTLLDGAWQRDDATSYNIGYTEDIGAAYFIATARLGRWSLVGGLRGEYTWFRSRDGKVNKNYPGLFPNANISYSLTKNGAYSIVAQYARTISRPSFWALSPSETKISEYMIQCGNPELNPSYDNSLSLTFVLKYKFNITLGMKITEDAIQQTTIIDKENPEVLIMKHINYPTLNNFYASANLPFQITKWWSTNLNVMAMYLGQRIYPEEPVRRSFMCTANAQMSFSLPKEFFIEVDGRYMHGLVAGNTRLDDMGNINLTLKKRMLDKRLTISIGIQNIIPTTQTITIEESTFKRVMTINQPWTRPSAKFQISYNFSAGKQFRAKSVESGSAADRERLGGGGNSNN